MTFFCLAYSPLRCTCQIIQKLQVSHILHQQINRGRTGTILTETADPSNCTITQNKQCVVIKLKSDGGGSELNMKECVLKWECNGGYGKILTGLTWIPGIPDKDL